MTRTEYTTLLRFYKAARVGRTHRNTLQGRRTVKGRAAGYGQVLKSSTIRPNAPEHLEKARPLQISFPANPREFNKPVYYKPL